MNKTSLHQGSGQQACINCQTTFTITDEDLKFYEKVSPEYGGKAYTIPLPTLCPDCRFQRRIAFRNERNLHRHNCSLCQKSIISSVPPESPYTVYCNDCWWSDTWSPEEYGIDFDYSRPFFDQFRDQLERVPTMGGLQMSNENCEYNHLIAFSKNSYLCPGSYNVEDCFYVRKSQYCKDCANSSTLNKCELVADAINCEGCYRSQYLSNCRNCETCSYLSDCNSLRDCLLCSGLNQKQYCFKNKQLSKDDFEKKRTEYEQKDPDDVLQELRAFNLTIPKRALIQYNCEGSTGDYLFNCKNAIDCCDCFKVEDSTYLFECEGVKDSMDLSMHDKDIQLCYELSSGGEQNYKTCFSYVTCASPRSLYMHSCFYAPDCFGCIGFHSKHSWCILNKQYTQKEFEQIVPRIIDHMKETGEWGEFFPVRLSPYAYNQSIAFDFFPLTKSEVEKKGWLWRDADVHIPDVEKKIHASKLPASIDDIPDDITNWAVECSKTGRPYRLTKPELEFYRKMHLPVPRIHPDERLKERMSWRNPRYLHDRTCDTCGKDLQSTYAPDRPETVLCEECYLKEVY